MNNRGKFEIRPWYQRDFSSKDALCVSQLHHPKATEVLSMKECPDYFISRWQWNQ